MAFGGTVTGGAGTPMATATITVNVVNPTRSIQGPQKIAARLSLRNYFFQTMNGLDPTNFVIRVNGSPANGDAILQEGDEVIITPSQFKGECR